jgi:HD superfamily phosphohydrolase
MTINDPIYGRFQIEEPVLVALINTKTIQRLKRIDQYGIPPKYYSFPGFSRFDHSIGVMLLLKKLGASLNEQIAGLLHDMSHTAFSHLTDWIWGDRLTEDYQDNIFSDFLKNSKDVTGILENYGIQYELFFNLHDFSLLERKSPDLCADRID